MNIFKIYIQLLISSLLFTSCASILPSTNHANNCQESNELGSKGVGDIYLINNLHLEASDIICNDSIIHFTDCQDSTKHTIATKKVRKIVFKDRLKGGLIGSSCVLIGAGIEAIQKSGEENYLPIIAASLTPVGFIIGYAIGWKTTFTCNTKEQIDMLKNKYKIIELYPNSIQEETDNTIKIKLGEQIGTFLKSQIKMYSNNNKTIIEVNEYLYYLQFDI